MREILDLVTISYYMEADEKKPLHNWHVSFGGIRIGQLHDCDGIGGEVGEFTETEVFDYACGLAELDLKSRAKSTSKVENNDVFLQFEGMTLADVIDHIKKHPELEPFLNKKIEVHCLECGAWDSKPTARFSYAHDSLVFEAD